MVWGHSECVFLWHRTGSVIKVLLTIHTPIVIYLLGQRPHNTCSTLHLWLVSGDIVLWYCLQNKINYVLLASSSYDYRNRNTSWQVIFHVHLQLYIQHRRLSSEQNSVTYASWQCRTNCVSSAVEVSVAIMWKSAHCMHSSSPFLDETSQHL